MEKYDPWHAGEHQNTVPPVPAVGRKRRCRKRCGKSSESGTPSFAESWKRTVFYGLIGNLRGTRSWIFPSIFWMTGTKQELNYWKGREDGSDWNCCVLRCVGWPVCLVTEPARASEGSGRGPGAGRISYGMEQESWEE